MLILRHRSAAPFLHDQDPNGRLRLTSAIAADKFSRGIVAAEPKTNCRHASFCGQADWGHQEEFEWRWHGYPSSRPADL